jgi:hypothetical protein
MGRHIHRRLAWLGLLTLFSLATACEEGSSESTAGLYQFIFGATEAIAIETCEGDGQSGQADVYHMVEILGAPSAEDDFTLLNDSLERLIQLGLDERAALGLASTNANVEVEDGYQVMFAIEGYENDPGGPTAESSREWLYEYDGRRACWWDTALGDTSREAPCTIVSSEYADFNDIFFVADLDLNCLVRFRTTLRILRLD